MSLRDKGQLQEEVCSRHKYFEWNLEGEFFGFSQYLDVTSPVFQVGHQRFYLEMSPKCRYTLRLYRLGPSVENAIYAWYSGVIRYQGSDQGLVYNGKVNLSEDLAEWKEIERLFTMSSSYLHDSCLRPDKKITFFFQINVIPMNFEKKEKILTIGVPACNHGALRTSPINTGIIVEREWELSKKVQWNIPCKAVKDCQFNNFCPRDLTLSELLSPKIVYKSPVFEISNQRYYFSLEINRDFSPNDILLYRLGPAVAITSRWWMQFKNGSNCIFVSRNMDLKRACIVWTYGKRLATFDRVNESSFSVEFLMSKVDITYAWCPPYHMTMSDGVMRSSSDGKSPLDFDPSRTEFISFRVLGHDFTVHRSLLIMRVPVFEAMLSHDTVESRTGVVCIDDSNPVVIGMFLHYLDTGSGPLWCDKFPLLTIQFAAHLFVVADKYLVPELRDKCLSFLEQIAQGKNTEYMMCVGDEVKELKDILSTYPPEILQKWPMINFIHNLSSTTNENNSGEK